MRYEVIEGRRHITHTQRIFQATHVDNKIIYVDYLTLTLKLPKSSLGTCTSVLFTSYHWMTLIPF